MMNVKGKEKGDGDGEGKLELKVAYFISAHDDIDLIFLYLIELIFLVWS